MVRKEFPGTLLCVDGITSVGALELRFDAWGIDACVTGSQKGLMTPPGVAFVALSERARKAIELSTSRRMYFDLRRALAVLTSNDTPWTPAITLLQGVDEALDMMYEEGLENIWARHARHAKAARNGLAALGLKLFSQAPSNALTAAWLPESVVWKELHQTLQTRFGITVAGGQGDYAGKILRISHLGYYDDLDMVTVVAALERALILSGFPATPGEGISAVQKSLSEIENTRTP